MLGSEGVQSYLKQRRKALGLEPTATLLSDSKDAEGSELEGNEQPLNTEMEDEVKVKVEEESKDGNEGKDKEVNEDEGIELLKAPAGLGEAQVTDQTRKLYEACLEGDFDKVRQAIQGGANLTLCDYSKKKQSAAHLLALSGNIKALRLLVRNGAGVRARDVEGYTPLHYAAKRGDGDMCDVLIALGARVTDANKLGQNAIDTSEFNGHVALRQAAPPLPKPPQPSLFLSSSVLSSSVLSPLSSFLPLP
ncbi:hypothetical protein GUITHDRAFT_120044 [Guillardia theta CCMP2712]|uniref:Uncharacterized protein n=1 Tax=Guillardia theta (strain CCMP2712) TaxID=905079 RepID=L1IC23_GUITC|nr:hypothetical protein GUITHDRAFT_120044 [Guillardia theta CCMP2712]EKX33776.1 hypothetical protein GUITHDRAFT_120044 [Guillardia theta CCMP2712]|eukprot:XP_005820756.1 hypothetical protein GUITHDRAFT_120044 [Guillardia theta CCMP2712]